MKRPRRDGDGDGFVSGYPGGPDVIPAPGRLGNALGVGHLAGGSRKVTVSQAERNRLAARRKANAKEPVKRLTAAERKAKIPVGTPGQRPVSSLDMRIAAIEQRFTELLLKQKHGHILPEEIDEANQISEEWDRLVAVRARVSLRNEKPGKKIMKRRSSSGWGRYQPGRRDPARYKKPSPKSTPKEIVGHHGHRPHGPSILWPALYEHLLRDGHTKAAAAAISNAAWKKKRLKMRTNTPTSARGVLKCEEVLSPWDIVLAREAELADKGLSDNPTRLT